MPRQRQHQSQGKKWQEGAGGFTSAPSSSVAHAIEDFADVFAVVLQKTKI